MNVPIKVQNADENSRIKANVTGVGETKAEESKIKLLTKQTPSPNRAPQTMTNDRDYNIVTHNQDVGPSSFMESLKNNYNVKSLTDKKTRRDQQKNCNTSQKGEEGKGGKVGTQERKGD